MEALTYLLKKKYSSLDSSHNRIKMEALTNQMLTISLPAGKKVSFCGDVLLFIFNGLKIGKEKQNFFHIFFAEVSAM